MIQSVHYILKAVNGKDIDMLTDGQEARQYMHTDGFGEALRILAESYDEIVKTKKGHRYSKQYLVQNCRCSRND